MRALSPAVIDVSADLAAQFSRGEPFRHLVIDDFLQPAFARRLLDEFPQFERGNARNEHGELGGKSVVEQIRALGPAFADVDTLIQSSDFLDWLSRVTAIPGLLYDRHYFGGGTHENRHGQELDPHVDFNRHPENGWHRRLNLIVYLNPEWHDDWGGSLELHSGPRADDNRIKLVTPLFNRCVIFETTETSWHGFSRIDLPDDRRMLSRRSLALYFYTRERPAEELGPNHSTIYVDRPLPARFAPGHVLSDSDVDELRVLLKRRDMHNERLYEEVMRLQATIDQARALGDAGPVQLFIHGVCVLLQTARRQRRMPDRPAIKQAMTPFVNALPVRLRSLLRTIWRRWIAAPAR